MLSKLMLVVSLVAAVFIMALPSTAVAAEAGSGIAGGVWVADGDRRHPVPGAHVVLKNADGEVVARTETNREGRFGFRARPGTYVVEAGKRGVGTGSARVVVERRRVSRVRIELSQ